MDRSAPLTQAPSEASPPAAALRRLPVESTGYYYAEPGPEARPPAPMLIGLHGYAQTAEDFLEVIRKWAPQDWIAASAQGFNQLWERSSKKITFSWMTSFEKADNISRNNRFLGSMIDQLAREGVCDPRGIFLLGFSQGSSVAYRFAQRYPERVRGVISICADLPPDVEANMIPLRKIPALIAYGVRDPLIPQEKSMHAAAALRGGGVDVELVSFDRGHLVPSSLAPRAQDWMRRVLKDGARP